MAFDFENKLNQGVRENPSASVHNIELDHLPIVCDLLDKDIEIQVKLSTILATEGLPVSTFTETQIENMAQNLKYKESQWFSNKCYTWKAYVLTVSF